MSAPVIPRLSDIPVAAAADTAFLWLRLSCCSWPEFFPYLPDVQVGLSHDGERVHLRYRVREQHVRAHAWQPNGEVWKDSCVEFFVMPNPDDGIYYNFEFNCIGAIRLSAGKARKGRTPSEPSLLTRIEVAGTMGREPFEEQHGDLRWSLDVSIPKTAFYLHTLPDLSGLRARANFYKCGDELTVPHFVSWLPIVAPAPDFHRPEFFGEVVFA